MKMRHALGKRTTMHQDVTGIIIKQVGADPAVTGRHLAGGGTEARWIVGDVVRLPALLFDSSREVTSDSRQVGEGVCWTFSSLPI